MKHPPYIYIYIYMKRIEHLGVMFNTVAAALFRGKKGCHHFLFPRVYTPSPKIPIHLNTTPQRHAHHFGVATGYII